MAELFTEYVRTHPFMLPLLTTLMIVAGVVMYCILAVTIWTAYIRAKLDYLRWKEGRK